MLEQCLGNRVSFSYHLQQYADMRAYVAFMFSIFLQGSNQACPLRPPSLPSLLLKLSWGRLKEQRREEKRKMGKKGEMHWLPEMKNDSYKTCNRQHILKLVVRPTISSGLVRTPSAEKTSCVSHLHLVTSCDP